MLPDESGEHLISLRRLLFLAAFVGALMLFARWMTPPVPEPTPPGGDRWTSSPSS